MTKDRLETIKLNFAVEFHTPRSDAAHSFKEVVAALEEAWRDSEIAHSEWHRLANENAKLRAQIEAAKQAIYSNQ